MQPLDGFARVCASKNKNLARWRRQGVDVFEIREMVKNEFGPRMTLISRLAFLETGLTWQVSRVIYSRPNLPHGFRSAQLYQFSLCLRQQKI